MAGIGILGGTFNPIHLAHLILAEQAWEEFNLQKVFFIPSAHPPHKQKTEVEEFKHRFTMTRLAIRENPFFEISDIEMKRKGKSYSIETVREMKKLYPKNEIFFIIGADALLELPLWKTPEKLLQECKFIVVPRPGYPLKEIPQRGSVILFSKFPLLGISSTEIRERIRKGKSIRYLTPLPVVEYIKTHRLYQKL
jgi:nicotinate-nucleotide adenylyltransferase